MHQHIAMTVSIIDIRESGFCKVNFPRFKLFTRSMPIAVFVDSVLPRLNFGVQHHHLHCRHHLRMQFGEAIHLLLAEVRLSICSARNGNAEDSRHIDFKIGHIAVRAFGIDEESSEIKVFQEFEMIFG